jgi:Uma2 family endonuclease
MASLPNSKTVTYEEWLRMPIVTDQIEEVVNGEIRLMPPNKLNHARIIANLSASLFAQFDTSKFLILNSTFGLVIRKSPLTTRVPDLAVFEVSTLVERDGYIHSAPGLIVEVLSPANRRREREEKLSDYASLGAPEFWVISPEARTVEVLHLEGGEFRCFGLLTDGVLAPKCFAGVQVPVSRIWVV